MCIVSAPCLDFILRDVGFSLLFKSWVYAYYYVLSHQYVCEHYCAGHLHFINLEDHLDQSRYYSPDPVPEGMLDTPAKFTEFWCSVKNWCDAVLHSHHFKLIFDGPNCGNGVGLTAAFSCKAEVVTRKIKGLLEPCNKSQSHLLKNVFKHTSLFETKEDKKIGLVHVLYGPASLLNNDKRSPFTFIDRKYVSNTEVMWKVLKPCLVGENNWEVMDEQQVKGIHLHTCDRQVYFIEGEQILVNYLQDNFIDLTIDSDDDDNNNCTMTPVRKRRFEYQPDSAYYAYASSCSSGSNRFDFGMSSSQSSNGSDSEYVTAI